ncbi:hypothetical protein HDU85_003912 [Gaertneriomyces sp. JEL0708]|nr:hypothetical protein HDU85_003912 [Gaertneriomyces sp. JEL0708]
MPSHTFTYHSSASSVLVTGTFTDWSHHVPLFKSGESENQWTTTVEVPIGEIQYKYIVDGNWICDESLDKRSDGFGGWNNVATVSACEPEDSHTANGQDVNPSNATEGAVDVHTNVVEIPLPVAAAKKVDGLPLDQVVPPNLGNGDVSENPVNLIDGAEDATTQYTREVPLFAAAMAAEHDGLGIKEMAAASVPEVREIKQTVTSEPAPTAVSHDPTSLAKSSTLAPPSNCFEVDESDEADGADADVESETASTASCSDEDGFEQRPRVVMHEQDIKKSNSMWWFCTVL